MRTLLASVDIQVNAGMETCAYLDNSAKNDGLDPTAADFEPGVTVRCWTSHV